MSNSKEFSFGDNSVAKAYDNVLVGTLFEPWAEHLIGTHQKWDGQYVLDLATGTGIVAEKLANKVGSEGKVFATDINPEMLALAKKRCAGIIPQEMFIVCDASSIKLDSESIDYVVCQQGFQFFPDKEVAAKEIFRVLNKGGKITASTWLPVKDCQYFGKLCEALEAIKENELSDMMRIPFDFMTQDELLDYFGSAGFVNTEINEQKLDFKLNGVAKNGVEIAYATPIGPRLRELNNEKQKQFKNIFGELLNEICENRTMGCMVSNILNAQKPN